MPLSATKNGNTSNASRVDVLSLKCISSKSLEPFSSFQAETFVKTSNGSKFVASCGKRSAHLKRLENMQGVSSSERVPTASFNERDGKYAHQ